MNMIKDSKKFELNFFSLDNKGPRNPFASFLQ